MKTLRLSVTAHGTTKAAVMMNSKTGLAPMTLRANVTAALALNLSPSQSAVLSLSLSPSPSPSLAVMRKRKSADVKFLKRSAIAIATRTSATVAHVASSTSFLMPNMSTSRLKLSLETLRTRTIVGSRSALIFFKMSLVKMPRRLSRSNKKYAHNPKRRRSARGEEERVREEKEEREKNAIGDLFCGE